MKKILFASLVALLALTACVKDEIYPYAAIDEVEYTYAYDAATPVDITAMVSSFVDIISAKLFYTAGDAEEVVQDMIKNEAGAYAATIPAFPMGTVVKYHTEFTTAAGVTTSKETNYTVGVTPPNYKAIKLNELNGNDKFIELINTGGADVELDGMYIEKDGKLVWTAQATHKLAPGALLLLYSEDVVVTGEAQEGYDATLVFASGLSAKKNVTVVLYNPSKKAVDYFNLTGYAEKCAASYSRVGADYAFDKWYHTAATPGAANAEDSSKPVVGLTELN
jgi:hypothetical protein